MNVYTSVSFLFNEEHKIPCECLYKCFFFLFHSFAEFGTNQSGLLTGDDDVGLNVLS